MRRGSLPCQCSIKAERPRMVAVTGGPGAGKSAVLELATRSFCSHVLILPEAATILFGGGFPRLAGEAAQRAAQRAIFHVQRELESIAASGERYGMVLCDRGTLDGLAYWPGDPEDFFRDLGIQRAQEMARYDAVLHLETPPGRHGYNHQNSVRVESPDEAHAIDQRILAVWADHSVRHVIPPSDDFPSKALRALQWLRTQLPQGCASSVLGNL